MAILVGGIVESTAQLPSTTTKRTRVTSVGTKTQYHCFDDFTRKEPFIFDY